MITNDEQAIRIIKQAKAKRPERFMDETYRNLYLPKAVRRYLKRECLTTRVDPYDYVS